MYWCNNNIEVLVQNSKNIIIEMNMKKNEAGLKPYF